VLIPTPVLTNFQDYLRDVPQGLDSLLSLIPAKNYYVEDASVRCPGLVGLSRLLTSIAEHLGQEEAVQV
jgi:hypothetical protein